MINEDITQRECNLAVRVGSIAYNELKKALEKLLAYLEQGKNNTLNKPDKTHAANKTPELKKGKQTLKDLQKHGEGLSTIELKDPNLRELYKSMKKDGVDFAPVKDGKGQYTLFFKAKDVDTLTHALKKYTQKLVKLDSLIVYSVITAYLFSREYSENTLKTILAIPVRKSTFLASKFAMLLLWILFLNLVSWIGMSVASVILHSVFGFADFGVETPLIYLGKMLLGGALMFFTLTPFAFLAIWTKGFVMPLIVSATVVMVNMLLINSDVAPLFPWTASFVITESGFMEQTSYSYIHSITSVAIVFILGFVLSMTYFHRKDVQ